MHEIPHIPLIAGPKMSQLEDTSYDTADCLSLSYDGRLSSTGDQRLPRFTCQPDFVKNFYAAFSIDIYVHFAE